jgi:hypothetical protein
MVILRELRIRRLVAENAKGHVGGEEAGEDEPKRENLH